MTGHIFLEGEIGSDVTAKTVRADIANYPQANDWTIHINSPGGDVYEGYQIGSIIKNLNKPTSAHIGAMCASIATYAALSCDTVIMNPHGDFMIHLPTGTINGTAEDLRRGAEQLDRIKSELIDRYAPKVARKGVTKEQLASMIEKETSMSPSEALSMGFIDGVQEKMKAVAQLTQLYNMEQLSREEAQGFFKAIGDKLDKFINGKFKNSVEIALADGTMAMSDAETVDTIIGSAMTLPTGPAPDGQYETADGYIINVAGGKVLTYEPVMEDKGEDPTAALKQQIADLQAQLQAKTNEAATVNAKAIETQARIESNFKNQMKAIKDELEILKTKTFGDDSKPDANPGFKADKSNETAMISPFINDVAGIFKTKLGI